MKLKTGFVVVIAVVLVVGMSGIGTATGLGKYKDTSKAEDDGYLPSTECVPNMGIHWIKPQLIDDTIQVGNPEALVFAKTDNGLKLIGVEYIATEEFTAFGQDSELTPEIRAHTLHSWFFTDAPLGKHNHISGDVDANCNYVG